MENIKAIFDFANTNQGALVAIATIVLVIITGIYAFLTRQLVVENRLLRRAGSEPRVVAYAVSSPLANGAIDFVIANIGQGAALNVSTEIVSGGEDFAVHSVLLRRETFSFSILPQGERIRTMLGMGWELLQEPKLKPFDVRVKCVDTSGRRHSETLRIDVSELAGISLIKPPEVELADAVKDIKKLLEKMTAQR